MSVQIPDFPDWLTRWVIGHFPVGKPDDIRAAADAWARSAERLTITLRHLERLAQDVPAAIQGAAGEAIQKQLKTEIANTRNQIEFADGMATLLYDSANAIELEQYIVIGIGAVLLANLLIDTAMPMKAASDRIAADVAATAARRDTSMFLLQRAATFMQRYPHIALAIRATILGAVSMGGVVAGAEYTQIVQGRGKPGRPTRMDWDRVWVAAAAGGGGGLVGSLATRAMLLTFTRIGANATTQVGRTTGRAVAIVLASATGGGAGGAAGAVTMSLLTHTELGGRNLAEMVMMGGGGGIIGGFGAAVRATRAMSAARPPEVTVPEIGRSRGSGDGLPVRSALDSARPGISADAPRSRGETIPEVGGSQHNSSREALPVRPEPERVSQHSTDDGSRPRPHKETIDEINELGKSEFDGKSYEEAFRRLDEGGSDPDQPPPGTSQASPASPTSPGNKPEPSRGSSPWDKGLQDLVAGNLGAAPADRVATSASPASNGTGTAQFHSNRPDSPQMKLAGTIVAAEGQPSATPGSVLTMNANPHAENNTHVASVADLGGAEGGNGPGVTAGPTVSHGDSPSGGGSGPRPPVSGEGRDRPPSDEDILLDLDFFDYEPVPNEPVTPTGNSPTATPHAAGTAPVEPGPGSGTGPTPAATTTEAKSPTAQTGASTGPGSTPATPVANTSHATPQANPPPQPHANPQSAQTNPPHPHATPQGAQANSPQQPSSTSLRGGADSDSIAEHTGSPIPAAVMGSAATQAGIADRPETPTGLLGELNGPRLTASDGLPIEPPEFVPPQAPLAPNVIPSYIPDPTTPVVPEYPMETPEEYTFPESDLISIPGRGFPQPDLPADAMPPIPHIPADHPVDLPETTPRYRPPIPIPIPQPSPEHPGTPDNRTAAPTAPPELSPPVRQPAAPSTPLPATPLEAPDPITPTRYATPPNPNTPGAPQDPSIPPAPRPDNLDYLPDHGDVPAHSRPSPWTLAPRPADPVEPNRPVPQAQAAPVEPGRRDRNRKQKPLAHGTTNSLQQDPPATSTDHDSSTLPPMAMPTPWSSQQSPNPARASVPRRYSTPAPRQSPSPRPESSSRGATTNPTDATGIQAARASDEAAQLSAPIVNENQEVRATPWQRTSLSEPGRTPTAPGADEPAPTMPPEQNPTGPETVLEAPDGASRPPSGSAVSFHNTVDERAALNLPQPRARHQPLGHRRGILGLDPFLAFHRDPDNSREWETGPGPDKSADDDQPESPDEISAHGNRSENSSAVLVEPPPFVSRVLGAAQNDAAEIEAEMLPPHPEIDVTILQSKDASQIEQWLRDLESRQKARLAAVLRRGVFDAVARHVLADEMSAHGVREIVKRARELPPFLEAAHQYVSDASTALAVLASPEVVRALGADPLPGSDWIGVVPGERVIVASPLYGQRLLLDEMRPDLREWADREGLRIEYWQVKISEDGDLAAEPISGEYAEPEAGIRYYTDSRDIVWMNDLADDRSFGEKMNEAIASGERERKIIKGNVTDPTMSEQVALVTYNNGYQAIEKTVRTAEHGDAEELASLTYRAVGAWAAAVLRHSESELVLLMEYVSGLDANEVHPSYLKDAWPYVFRTPGARRLGLGDTLVRPWDRHEGGNWRFMHLFKVVGIDHSNAYDYPHVFEGFAKHFEAIHKGGKHSHSRAELATIRQRIIDLEPEYRRLNRMRWFAEVLAIFGMIEEHAADDIEPMSTDPADVLAMLEKLRDSAGRGLLPMQQLRTIQEWHTDIAIIRRGASGNPYALGRLDVLESLVHLHLHAQLKQVSADQLDGTSPENIEKYLDDLSQWRTVLEEKWRSPTFKSRLKRLFRNTF